MTRDANRRPNAWDRAWVLWASSGALLAVVAALVIVAATGVGAPATDAAPADAAPPGLNRSTAALLGVAPVPTDHVTAPSYRLTDQDGRTVDSAALRGKVVVLTFNDDKCTDLCAMLADDIVAADADLPKALRSEVEFVSINANPYYPQAADVAAWSTQNGLDALPNWEYLTGSPTKLASIARAYDVPIELNPTSRTIAHGSQIFIIDPRGRIVSQAAFGPESADTAPFGHGLAVLAADALPAADPAAAAGQNLAASIPGGTGIGDTPSPISGASLTGAGTVSSASTRGDFTVIDFWSSTCDACSNQLAADRRESRRLGSAIAFLGVDVDVDPTAGRAALADEQFTLPTLQDPNGIQAARFRASELPYTVILSPGGKVLVRHPGLFTQDELDYVLRDVDSQLPAVED